MRKRKKNQQHPPPAQPMADWSQLPKELLQLISKRLDSKLYLLRFRSVCSMWRSSISNHHLPSPNADNNNTPTFSLYKHNIFLIKPPPHKQRQTLRPWLIKIGQDSHGQTHHLHTLSRASTFPSHFPRVLDFNKFPVLDLGCVFIFPNSTTINIPGFSLDPVKVVSTKWQGEEPLVILTFNLDGQLAMFCCDNDGWTVIPNKSSTWTWTVDICIFKGQPYAVDSNGQTVMVGLDSSVYLVAEPVFGGGAKFLVESEGELLLVDKYSPHDSLVDKYPPYDEFYGVGQQDSSERAMRFNVFRLEAEEKRWVELTSLGDRVLFLMDDCTFSASALDLCVTKGNCVIYSHRYDDFDSPNARDCEMSIFHLDQGRIFPLSKYPSYSKLFWPPPHWVNLR